STVELPIIDLRHLAEEAREAEAQRVIMEEVRRPMNLTTGPLMRTTLLRLGEQDHLFVLTMHHIACDGWSMGEFIWELTSCYWAFARQEPSPLPELPIQYDDYAIWQREWLKDGALADQLAYWKRALADMAALSLPMDRSRPAELSYRGARVPFSVAQHTRGALAALSTREGVTVFMTLVAALQTLLSRHSGQDDVAIGAPIAGRNRTELEPLIGFFVNTLVLR